MLSQHSECFNWEDSNGRDVILFAAVGSYDILFEVEPELMVQMFREK